MVFLNLVGDLWVWKFLVGLIVLNFLINCFKELIYNYRELLCSNQVILKIMIENIYMELINWKIGMIDNIDILFILEKGRINLNDRYGEINLNNGVYIGALKEFNFIWFYL